MTSPARDVIAGIGFRHGAVVEDIARLVRRAFDAAGLPIGRLRALATAADRVDEAVVRETASVFGVEALGLDPAALRAVDAAVPTRSPRIEAGRGVGSLAEAAALAAAGRDAILICPRLKAPMATCALALVSDSL